VISYNLRYSQTVKLKGKKTTLYDFIAMDEMEQAEAIWSGVHIADGDGGEHKILLTRSTAEDPLRGGLLS
jgi:hypothetical protein